MVLNLGKKNTAESTIGMKGIFAKTEIAKELQSKNMPLNSRKFPGFITSWTIIFTTSSPGYVERKL